MTKTWLDYVDSLTWERGQLDPSCYLACLRAASLNINGAEVISVLAQKVKDVGGELRMGKLRHQYEAACRFVKANPGNYDLRTVLAGSGFSVPPKPEFVPNPRAVQRNACRLGIKITPAWLRACSLLTRLRRFTPADFLRELYYPGERVVIFTNPRSQGDLWRIGPSMRWSRLDKYRRGYWDGVWFSQSMERAIPTTMATSPSVAGNR